MSSTQRSGARLYAAQLSSCSQLLYTMGGSESIEYAKKAFMQAYELKPKNNPRALYGVCLVWDTSLELLDVLCDMGGLAVCEYLRSWELQSTCFCRHQRRFDARVLLGNG